MTPANYDYLCRFLRERSGLDLSADKQYLVEGRLSQLARKSGLSGLDEIVQRIKASDMRIIDNVVEAMTTNETSFFRDKIPFNNLREVILPALLQARAAKRSLRIWCAAGSTGQEAYSIAMCLKEMGASIGGWRTEIVATDLSRAVLEKSASGEFSQFEVQRGLPIRLLLKYFKQAGEHWRISDELRAMVQHRQLNLMHDFSHLGSFDVIFCRNVLIYFDRPTRTGIFQRLSRVIEPDGYLALGAAETVMGLTDAFKPHPECVGSYRPTPIRAAPSIVPAMSASQALPAKTGSPTRRLAIVGRRS